MTSSLLEPQIDALKQMLPPAPSPAGSYVPVKIVGNLLYTSGILPMKDGKIAYVGALGSWNIGIEQGQAAAELCIRNALSVIDNALDGQWHRFKSIVKVTGFINCLPNFYDQPEVMNGASDFLVQHLGEAGRHVRSAVGVASLPRNASVEIEVIVELTD